MPLQRINWIPGYLVGGCLSDEPLKPKDSLWLRGCWSSSCPAVPALGSRTWPGPRCHTLSFKDRCLFGPFFSQLPLFLSFHDVTCCFHPFVFPCIKKKKKKSSNKTVSLRVKVLQIQACYLYSIIMNNSPTLMPCVWLTCNYGLCFLQRLWMVFSSGCSLSRTWNPWVTWKRVDYIDSTLLLLLFFLAQA